MFNSAGSSCLRVMMNGRSNSSAAGLVAVRVPEDEKSWYGVSGVTPIIIVIVMSLRSRLTVFTRLGYSIMIHQPGEQALLLFACNHHLACWFSDVPITSNRSLMSL